MAELFGVDARHVDVAILYGIGMKDRAQHIARELRPINRVEASLPGYDTTDSTNYDLSFSGPGPGAFKDMNPTSEELFSHE